MAVGFLSGRRIEISAGGGWTPGFNFWSRAAGQVATPIPLTGCTLRATLTLANQTPPATPIDISSFLALAGSVNQTVAGVVPIATTTDWPQGDYDFELHVVDPSGTFDRYTLLSEPSSSRVRVVA